MSLIDSLLVAATAVAIVCAGVAAWAAWRAEAARWAASQSMQRADAVLGDARRAARSAVEARDASWQRATAAWPDVAPVASLDELIADSGLRLRDKIGPDGKPYVELSPRPPAEEEGDALP